MDHGARMDRIYGFQRHFYDLTRRPLLPGRDRLLESVACGSESRILEVGCGTARNLRLLARRCPEARLFGLDASRRMLDTAVRRLRRDGLDEQIVLRRGSAEELDRTTLFGSSGPFDAILFSYSLSMMPGGVEALESALRVLARDGRIHIADFWDLAELPSPFRAAFRLWLRLFHVEFRPEPLEHLRMLAAAGKGRFEIEPLRRRYAYVARYQRIDPHAGANARSPNGSASE